jgi:hypothetical protein
MRKILDSAVDEVSAATPSLSVTHCPPRWQASFATQELHRCLAFPVSHPSPPTPNRGPTTGACSSTTGPPASGCRPAGFAGEPLCAGGGRGYPQFGLGLKGPCGLDRIAHVGLAHSNTVVSLFSFGIISISILNRVYILEISSNLNKFDKIINSTP